MAQTAIMAVTDMGPARMTGVTEAPTLREQRATQTREHIRDVAIGLFEQQGLRATTVEEIARAAGIAPRTFFRYFPTKEDVVLDWFGSVRAFVEHAPLVGDTPRATLRAIEQIVESGLGLLFSDLGKGVDVRPYQQSRRLVEAEPDLLSVMTSREWELRQLAVARLTDHFAGRADPLEVAMIFEVATATVRTALDAWATDPSVELITHYRQARAALAALVAP